MAHNLKVVGSNPTPATKINQQLQDIDSHPRVAFRVADLNGATLVLRLEAPRVKGCVEKHDTPPGWADCGLSLQMLG